MKLFRLHIRPTGGRGDPKISFAYCLNHSCLGLGWAVDTSSPRDLDWPTYFELAKKKYGIKGMSRVIYFKENVKVNDLIWTRDATGVYYVARIIGDWKYQHSQDADDADILNIMPCDLRRIENVDDVPGKVIAHFRSRSTIQRIYDPTTVLYSQLLWNDLVGPNQYEVIIDKTSQNLFSLLNSEQCEDLVFIFLQTLDWLVIPNSRKIDTMAYEFILIHRKTKKRAIVQVKTGNTVLNADDWKGRKESVFLFQANGLYSGTESQDVTLLSPKELEKFVQDNPPLLPGNINRWVNKYASLTSLAATTFV